MFLCPLGQALGSHEEYLAAMAQNQDKLVVVKFFDQFCRACDEIRPRYEELSRSQPSDTAAFFELEVRSDKGWGSRRHLKCQVFLYRIYFLRNYS